VMIYLVVAPPVPPVPIFIAVAFFCAASGGACVQSGVIFNTAYSQRLDDFGWAVAASPDHQVVLVGAPASSNGLVASFNCTVTADTFFCYANSRLSTGSGSYRAIGSAVHYSDQSACAAIVSGGKWVSPSSSLCILRLHSPDAAGCSTQQPDDDGRGFLCSWSRCCLPR
jgi:hypothetical protein